MIRALLAVAMLIFTARPVLAQAEAVIDSEVAPAKVKKTDGLGTHGYEPRKREKPFLEKLPKGADQTGSMFEA